ncbi:hypothetical protein [Rathayibacter toxicus]|uniref:Uncharacterized protein n=1 Tax=Rathayibacter toxicus TaxID=145458 RepID=A0A0C5BC95_9MICO|nr:hypothetical protein [Rathayibacter toxicus]AJM76801.1 hypothetical protein TI83_00110 [Rathayibacter toxicus]ALS57439.1 hypothetical protein APU90_06370 [Rathayibacter toxicus]KKM44466.1 hypothetical protein VT73_09875 [Rathayibacter toxicus]PPG20896.1 hypothetical protein C5D15_10560 [Rathayibacter toxicus]PPG46000.1 hypothetical protein C5D16_10535 [Rathayibacter toxicus]
MTDPLDSSPRLDDVEIHREEVQLRRSPRVWRILALGCGIGAIIAWVLAFALPATDGLSQGQIFGVSFLVCVTLCGGSAALVVVILERLVGHRVVRTTAERIVSREGADAGSSGDQQEPGIDTRDAER